jgi:hypothetical protein
MHFQFIKKYSHSHPFSDNKQPGRNKTRLKLSRLLHGLKSLRLIPLRHTSFWRDFLFFINILIGASQQLVFVFISIKWYIIVHLQRIK